MALSKQQIDELEAKHGRIAHVKGAPLPGDEKGEPAWEIVLRKPRRAEYKVYRANVTKEIPEATEYFILATCVYPATTDALEALLDEWPGIPEASANACHKLAGIEVDKAVK